MLNSKLGFLSADANSDALKQLLKRQLVDIKAEQTRTKFDRVKGLRPLDKPPNRDKRL